MHRGLGNSFFSAALFGASLYPSVTGLLAVVAFAFLAHLLVDEVNPWLGGLYGVAAWLGLALATALGAGVRLWWSLPVLLAIFGIGWFLVGAAVVVLRKRLPNGAVFILVPALFVAVEFLAHQRWLYGDLTVGALAYTQAGTPLGALAGWGGTSVVVAAVSCLGLGLAYAFRGRLVAGAILILPILVVSAVPVPGSVPLNEPATLKVAAIQSAQSRESRHAAHTDPLALDLIMRAFEEPVRAAVEGGAELVVMGENVMPLINGVTPESVRRVVAQAPATVIGGPYIVGSNIFNGAFTWSGSELTPIYRKQTLVPLIEGHYARGYSSSPVMLQGAFVGMGICLDTLHAYIARKAVQDGAEFLLFITDDSFAGRTLTPYVHLATAALRAAETGRAAVFANEWGPSGIIDNRGRFIAQVPLGQAGIVSAEVPLLSGTTPFIRHGDLVGPFALVVVVGSVLVAAFMPGTATASYSLGTSRQASQRPVVIESADWRS